MKIFLFDFYFREEDFLLVWICSRRLVVAYQESKVTAEEFEGFQGFIKEFLSNAGFIFKVRIVFTTGEIH